MKKILYIFLILSIFSTGCSKEDDVQITQEVTNNLDANLYGVWKLNQGSISYYRSFSSNGKFGSWREDNDLVPEYEISGDWWVEQNNLITQEMDYSSSFGSYINTYIFDYSVSGDELLLNQGIWTKQ